MLNYTQQHKLDFWENNVFSLHFIAMDLLNMYYLLGHTSLLQSLCPSSDPMHSWPPFWALSNLVLCLDCWPPPHITEQPLQEFQSLHWQSTKHRINTLWYEKLKMIELAYFYSDRIWFSMCNKSIWYFL